MDLTLSPEQESLLTATADWCRDALPLEAARHRSLSLWDDLEAMGYCAMTALDMGLDHATEALVFAELGRHLAPIGLLATAIGGRWVGPGRYALALPAHGKLRLFDPDNATAAIGLWEDQAGLVLVPASARGVPGLDLSAPMATLDIVLTPNPIDDPRAALHLQLLTAAYALGCAEAARDMAADYAKLREQFDRPIGWFQSIKHMAADMAVRTEAARAQLCYAACALDDGAEDAAFHIAAVRRLAGDAAIANGRVNIQIHGGIGMTDEASPHLCLKRAHLLSFIAPPSRAILLGDTA